MKKTIPVTNNLMEFSFRDIAFPSNVPRDDNGFPNRYSILLHACNIAHISSLFPEVREYTFHLDTMKTTLIIYLRLQAAFSFEIHTELGVLLFDEERKTNGGIGIA